MRFIAIVISAKRWTTYLQNVNYVADESNLLFAIHNFFSVAVDLRHRLVCYLYAWSTCYIAPHCIACCSTCASDAKVPGGEGTTAIALARSFSSSWTACGEAPTAWGSEQTGRIKSNRLWFGLMSSTTRSMHRLPNAYKLSYLVVIAKISTRWRAQECRSRIEIMF